MYSFIKFGRRDVSVHVQELRYDLSTTVSEAIEQLSSKINLQNYSTFALFESNMGSDRSGALTGEVAADESVLKDKEYIPDVLASALSMRAGSGAYNTKLLFKKKLFRESDEAITEPQFVKLSYVQVCCNSKQTTPCPVLSRHYCTCVSWKH